MMFNTTIMVHVWYPRTETHDRPVTHVYERSNCYPFVVMHNMIVDDLMIIPAMKIQWYSDVQEFKLSVSGSQYAEYLTGTKVFSVGWQEEIVEILLSIGFRQTQVI